MDQGGRAQRSEDGLVPAEPLADQAGELGHPYFVAGRVGVAVGDGGAERGDRVTQGALQALLALEQGLVGAHPVGDVERGAEHGLDLAVGAERGDAVGHEMADLAVGEHDAVVDAVEPAGDGALPGGPHGGTVVGVAGQRDLVVAEPLTGQAVDALPLVRDE